MTLESCVRVPMWQRNKKIVLCSVQFVNHTGCGRRKGSWNLAHILLKHSLALDHTWIPWKKKRKPKKNKKQKTVILIYNEVFEHLTFRVCEHMEQGQKAKIPFYTCWSALWHSWWVLHADLCFSAPWSVQCPPRLFVQTLCRRRHKQRESTDDTGDKEYLKMLRQLPFAPNVTFTCYPVTLRKQRLIMTVLKVRWHISVIIMQRNVL